MDERHEELEAHLREARAGAPSDAITITLARQNVEILLDVLDDAYHGDASAYEGDPSVLALKHIIKEVVDGA